MWSENKYAYFDVGANDHTKQAAIGNVCYRTEFPTSKTVFTSMQANHIQCSRWYSFQSS